MTAIEPPDDLPPVPAPAVHDMIVGLYGLLAEQPETVIIEQEAWDDPLPPAATTLRDDFGAQDSDRWTGFRDDSLPPHLAVCIFDGIHCRHWASAADPCCHCGSVTDSDDMRCHGRLR